VPRFSSACDTSSTLSTLHSSNVGKEIISVVNNCCLCSLEKDTLSNKWLEPLLFLNVCLQESH
jgi:hypothetical protein